MSVFFLQQSSSLWLPRPQWLHTSRAGALRMVMISVGESWVFTSLRRALVLHSMPMPFCIAVRRSLGLVLLTWCCKSPSRPIRYCSKVFRSPFSLRYTLAFSYTTKHNYTFIDYRQLCQPRDFPTEDKNMIVWNLLTLAERRSEVRWFFGASSFRLASLLLNSHVWKR